METNQKVVEINGVKYVPQSEAKQVFVEFTGEETVASTMIGKKVIVRSRNEGVNAGIVKLASESGVILTDCRRLWFHKPSEQKVSWYEGVAVYGLGKGSKVSCTVEEKAIIEDYSMTLCSDVAFESIMKESPNAQN